MCFIRQLCDQKKSYFKWKDFSLFLKSFGFQTKNHFLFCDLNLKTKATNEKISIYFSRKVYNDLSIFSTQIPLHCNPLSFFSSKLSARIHQNRVVVRAVELCWALTLYIWCTKVCQSVQLLLSSLTALTALTALSFHWLLAYWSQYKFL